MKRIHALALVMATSFSLPAFAVDPDGNPPGPAGGPGASPDRR